MDDQSPKCMHLTEEQLQQITEAATAGYTPKQVAMMLGYDIAAFCEEVMNEDSAINVAYFKGFFSAEFAVRRSVINLAVSGSNPAQTQSLKLFDEARRELRRDEYPSFD